MVKNTTKLILATILLSISNVSYAQDNVIDEIIWVVGDEAILKSDVERARLELQARGERFDGDPYCFIPEQLAEQKLYLDQAKVDSIDVSMGDVNSQVSRQEQNAISHLGSKEKVEEYLGQPMVELREEWREQIKSNMLMSNAQESIIKKSKGLTPSEVRKYYNSLAKDSLPYIPTNVEVQIITYDPIIPLEETDKIKERLRGFTERINSGSSSFATLAIMYSEDPGSAQNGGELGFMGRAQLLPEFSNVAFSLSDPSKVSNVVETEYGFHIIQLIERRGDRANFRHILLKPQTPETEMAKAITRMDSLANDIRKEVVSFDEAAVFSSNKDTRKSGGLMVNHERSAYGIPRFALEELPSEVAQMVNTMQVGEISAPFRMINKSSSKEVVAVIKLRNKIEGHTANVSDDYQVLKDLVEDKNRQETLNKWLQKKIDKTYVRINPKWVNCDFRHPGWKNKKEENNN